MTENRSAKLSRVNRASEERLDDALADSMSAIDYMLMNEPMLAAPFNFADKVMAAIGAGKQPDSRHSYYRVQRFILGLALMAVIIAPIILVTIIAVGHLVSDPDALRALLQQALQQIMLLLNTLWQTLTTIFQTAVQIISASTVRFALAALALPVTLLWAFAMWYSAQRRQQVVYRIPVQVM